MCSQEATQTRVVRKCWTKVRLLRDSGWALSTDLEQLLGSWFRRFLYELCLSWHNNCLEDERKRIARQQNPQVDLCRTNISGRPFVFTKMHKQLVCAGGLTKRRHDRPSSNSNCQQCLQLLQIAGCPQLVLIFRKEKCTGSDSCNLGKKFSGDLPTTF